LLDEVLGMAVHASEGTERLNIVTAEMNLKYRRPAPTEEQLTIRGRVARIEAPNYFLEGEIVDDSGTVLTRAEARFRRLD
jgi:acyl-coenzyme A thioesterase PaaI-like protein